MPGIQGRWEGSISRNRDGIQMPVEALTRGDMTPVARRGSRGQSLPESSDRMAT